MKKENNRGVAGTHAETAESSWKGIYKLGGAAALIFVLTALLDVVASIMAGEAAAPDTLTATDWFTLFQSDPFHAFQNLGLFNIIEQVLMILVFFALYAAHRKIDKVYAALAMILQLLGTAVYISNSAAVPMFVLSGKYAAATTDAQRSIFLAAGQAILARGEDFTPGAFMGFLFLGIAGIAISCIMLRRGIFSKAASYSGILGTVILFAFTLWATFVPASYKTALVFAMFGGLLSMAWLILIARRLFQLARLA